MGNRDGYVSGVSEMRLNRVTRGWITLILATAILILMASPVHAFSVLSDQDLSEVYAEGYSSFTLETDVLDPTKTTARALLNIETRTFTEIDSLKMGYYEKVPGSGFGWDEDWTNVSLGSATEDLVCKGLFIEAKFSNLSDPATRTLEYIKVGTPHMTGPITAEFNSFSGRIENGTGGLVYEGVRQNLGKNTIYSNNDEFYLELTATGSQAGWHVFWKNATITPVP